MRRRPSPVLRLKGIVRLDGDDAYRLLNVVGDEIHVETLKARPVWFDSVITVVTRRRGATTIEELVREHLEPGTIIPD